MSVINITNGADYLYVCFWKMKGDPLPNQLITFTRCFPEALPIKYRDFPSAAHKQAGTF